MQGPRQAVAAAATRADRRWPAAAAVLALLALAVLADGAGGHGLGVAVPATAARPVSSVVLAAYAALLVVAAAVMATVVWLLWPGRHTDGGESVDTRPPLTLLQRVLAVALALLLFGAVAGLFLLARRGAAHGAVITWPALPLHALRPAGGAADTPGGGTTSTLWLKAGLAAGALLVAGVFAAAWLTRSRRRLRARRPVARTQPQDVLTRAVSLSLEDLRREPDPRRAIVAAYAHMERLLEQAGVVRPGSETVTEYLARVLRAGNAPRAAATELTGLFEEARFSRHHLSEADRQRALVALVEIRESLAS